MRKDDDRLAMVMPSPQAYRGLGEGGERWGIAAVNPVKSLRGIAPSVYLSRVNNTRPSFVERARAIPVVRCWVVTAAMT